MKSRLALLSASALLVATGLAACGKESVPPASSGDPTTTTSSDAEGDPGESPTETTVSEEGEEDGQAAGPAELTYTATEYAYATAGDTGAGPITAGEVAITVTNEGAEEHQLSIAKLREGRTLDDLAALGSDPSQLGEVLETYGGPNGIAPGETVTSTQFLPAGDFLFLCFIPAPDGEPHAVKGMLMPVTVEGDAEAPVAPTDGEALVLDDFEFGLGTAEEPAEISGGDLVITNEGTQPHEAAIYTLPEGTTNEDVVAYFSDPNAEASGPPPLVGAGGIGPIDAGRFAEVTLESGDYVFVCFIPDAETGAPHFALGMLQFATVA